MFQPTYLYKIRRILHYVGLVVTGFNPRTSIRYDHCTGQSKDLLLSFNPRTSIRYDKLINSQIWRNLSFNPRTSIRYDRITNNTNIYSLLPISLCDNKLFGFFIDEIEPIDMCNRLIINECENPGF